MLKGKAISVLREAEGSGSILERFLDEDCASHSPRIMILDTSSGRRGAGEAGIPFVEFFHW
jgi:hypothetical protein